MPERKPFGEFLFETLQAAAQAGLDITQQAQNVRQEKQLLALDLALKEKTAREGLRQFNVNVKLKREELTQKASQFDVSAGLRKQEIEGKEKTAAAKAQSDAAIAQEKADKDYFSNIRREVGSLVTADLKDWEDSFEEAGQITPTMRAQKNAELQGFHIKSRVQSDFNNRQIGGADIQRLGGRGFISPTDVSEILGTGQTNTGDTGTFNFGNLQGIEQQLPEGTVLEDFLPALEQPEPKKTVSSRERLRRAREKISKGGLSKRELEAETGKFLINLLPGGLEDIIESGQTFPGLGQFTPPAIQQLTGQRRTTQDIFQ